MGAIDGDGVMDVRPLSDSDATHRPEIDSDISKARIESRIGLRFDDAKLSRARGGEVELSRAPHQVHPPLGAAKHLDCAAGSEIDADAGRIVLHLRSVIERGQV